MRSIFKHRFHTRKAIFLLGTLLIATASITQAQTQPQLQITSPADGTVVAPGQIVSVAVASPTGTIFTKIAVVGENPIAMSDVASSVPAQFSITIPANAAHHPYALSAFGIATTGDVVQSQIIRLDVEKTDPATAIAGQPSTLTFESQGEHLQAQVFATYSDSTVVEITESSNVSYSSSNTNVAKVDASGIVTAVRPGTAAVTATYSQPTQVLQTSINVTVFPPALTPSPVEFNFGGETGVNVGTSVSGQMTLTNTTKSDNNLKIVSVSATGDFSETDNCVSSTPWPVGGACTVNVTFTPTAAGTRTGTLNISNNFSPTISIPLSGSANNNFNISVDPIAQTVTAGGSINYTITASIFDGFSGAISLGTSGLPTGATATFTPPSITTDGGTSTLTVTTSLSTPGGSYPLTISGTNGNVTLNTVPTLTVTVPPSIRLFMSPANSTTPGLKQLTPSGGVGNTYVSSADLANQPAGDYLIQAFDTQAGVPGTSGIWHAGTSGTVKVWMAQTAGTSGTLFTKVMLFLNSPSGTPVCTAVSPNPLAIDVHPNNWQQDLISLTCTPSSDITVTATDRYYLWVGVSSTAVPTATTQAEVATGQPARGFGAGYIDVPPLAH